LKPAKPKESVGTSTAPTRRSLQHLVDQVAGYGIGAVINRVLGIIVACIYPMLLSKDEYGRLDVVFSVTGLLGVVFYLGLDSSLPRFYFEEPGAGERKKLVSTIFYSVVLFSLISVGILLLASKPLALWLYEDPRYVYYFRLMLLGMPLTMASNMALVVLRLQRRVREFNMLMAANLAVAAIFGISSILLFKIGAAGVLVGFICGNAATAIAGIWSVRTEISAAPFGCEMKKLLDVGFPLAISGTAMWLVGSVNRPILVRHVPADDIGLYAIASGAIGMFGMLIAAFRNAWQPFAFSIMKQQDHPYIYARALTLFTALGTTAAAGMALFSPQVLLLINLYTHKNWSGAAPSVGPLAIGTVFSAMCIVVQTGVFIARRTRVIVIAVGIAALVNAILNFLMIPYWGIMGAAMATALGHLAALVSGYFFSQRFAPVPYPIGKLTTTLIAGAVAIAAGSMTSSGAVIRDTLVGLLILVIYCAVLFVSRTVTRDDLLILRNISWYGSQPEVQTPGSQIHRTL